MITFALFYLTVTMFFTYKVFTNELEDNYYSGIDILMILVSIFVTSLFLWPFAIALGFIRQIRKPNK
jgi:hypothetical protein